MLNNEVELTKETFLKISEFLSGHDKEEAIDALFNLTEKQGLGILAYIQEKKLDMITPPLTVVKWVLHDISGFCKGSDMFIPVTRKYQPKD